MDRGLSHLRGFLPGAAEARRCVRRDRVSCSVIGVRWAGASRCAAPGAAREAR